MVHEKLLRYGIRGRPCAGRVAVKAVAVFLACLPPLLLSEVRAERVAAALDPTLAANPVHRWLLGGGYRSLWQTPIEVETVNLETFAGGLTPRFRVGGEQTMGLALVGADGKSYTFRSVVKDLSPTLPPDFRGYLIDDLVQDQLGASHPMGPLIAAPLAAAAGVPYTPPALVMMPDDPGLGEFRSDFAGVIGTLQEYPTARTAERDGFLGAREILSSRDFWRKMVADPRQRPDEKSYLRARLLDFFLGDWDRHPNQWRWASVPGSPRWLPIPEDRDQALSSYEGAVLFFFRPFEPKFVPFEADYPSALALTLQGWEIDRWLLAELDEAVWVTLANELRGRLTDAVIDAAVAQMPAAYLPLAADALTDTLKHRRDRLPVYAQRVYRFLAQQVDVQGTDGDETVTVQVSADNTVAVTVAVQGQTYFMRRFEPGPTRAIRLYLRGGTNRVNCAGGAASGITLHVVGRTAADVLTGCDPRWVKFMDIEEFQRRQNPPSNLARALAGRQSEAPLWRRGRDWGKRVVPVYRVGLGSSLGLVLGGGVSMTRYRFGKLPFAERHVFEGAYSFGLGGVEASYTGRFRHGHPGWRSQLEVSGSQLELARFFGFGNETSDEGDSDFFKTEQTQYRIEPSTRYALSPRLDLIVGGRLRYSSTDDDEDTLLTRTSPYGAGKFGEIGLFAGLDYDTTVKPYGPGLRGRVRGAWIPELWDVVSDYGTLDAELSAYHPLSDDLLISARLAGAYVSGDFPYQSAAYLGENSNLRGYDINRFAGDASLLLNTEFRYRLGYAGAIFFRGEWGLLAFADVGRVWLDGEDSDEWHPSGGLGISLATLDRAVLGTFTVARSEEGTRFLFESGFSF